MAVRVRKIAVECESRVLYQRIDAEMNVLDWFVNTFRGQGRAIEKGWFVMTGTTTGIHAPARGQRAVADFGDLGNVEVTFA